MYFYTYYVMKTIWMGLTTAIYWEPNSGITTNHPLSLSSMNHNGKWLNKDEWRLVSWQVITEEEAEIYRNR